MTRAIQVGVLLRLLAFPFAEDLWADAPIRADMALAWARAPGLWWSYREVAQFGPLPTHLEGCAVLLGLAPRVVPLLAGMLGLWCIGRVAHHFGGAEGAAFAVWTLALSPLHLQASTTCASEALFLLFALLCIEGAITGRDGLLLLGAFLAATTRFDAWLWLPPLGLLLLWQRRSVRALGVALLLGLGPASILLANALALHRPLAPLQHISAEHTALAVKLVRDHGPMLSRLRAVLFWPGAALVVLTPLSAVLALRGLRRPRGRALVPALVALGPPLVYAVRSALTGTFLPMLRLAGPPAELLTAFAVPPSPRRRKQAIAVALLFDLALLALATLPNPLQQAARVATPVSRLPEELRQGVAWVQASERVALDQSPGCEDIVIAHHAGRERFQLYAPASPPRTIVSIRGAPLDVALRRSGEAFGERCRLSAEAAQLALWQCER